MLACVIVAAPAFIIGTLWCIGDMIARRQLARIVG